MENVQLNKMYSVDDLEVGNRGVTAIFGYVVVFAIVLSMVGALLLFGLPMTGEADIRGDSVFDYTVTSENEFGIEYVDGDEFRNADTHRLSVVNRDTGAEYSYDDYPLAPGEELISPDDEDVPDDLLGTGERVEIVFVNTDGGSDTIDTVSFPTTDQLGTTDVRDTGGGDIDGIVGVS